MRMLLVLILLLFLVGCDDDKAVYWGANTATGASEGTARTDEPPSTIPCPGALTLVALGTAGIGWLRRRKMVS